MILYNFGSLEKKRTIYVRTVVRLVLVKNTSGFIRPDQTNSLAEQNPELREVTALVIRYWLTFEEACTLSVRTSVQEVLPSEMILWALTVTLNPSSPLICICICTFNLNCVPSKFCENYSKIKPVRLSRQVFFLSFKSLLSLFAVLCWLIILFIYFYLSTF